MKNYHVLTGHNPKYGCHMVVPARKTGRKLSGHNNLKTGRTRNE